MIFSAAKRNVIYTIGHSNRRLEDFLDLLHAYRIESIIDIRAIPRSSYNPQFSQESLRKKMRSQKIRYVHLKKLGGFRHPKKESLNTGWKNASFRGFADYMQTKGFQEGLDRLMALSKKHICALMCAEAVPWRCHRSLIADVLTKNKWQVFHIQSMKTAKLHAVTPFLHRVGKMLVYTCKAKETLQV